MTININLRILAKEVHIRQIEADAKRFCKNNQNDFAINYGNYYYNL